ncbi:O-antigen ligase family protein [Providencia rettgeri]|nr:MULTISPECIES: O-antigen ligase family protein [Providencia]MDH2397119.1 O-antigen ligase family protein [Providencia rettgeri]
MESIVMQYVISKNSFTPVIFASIFSLAIIFYQGPHFLPKVTWGLLILLSIALITLKVLKKAPTISLSSIKIAVALTLWLSVPFTLSYKYIDPEINYKLGLETILYVISCLLYLDYLFKNNLTSNFINFFSTIWLLISFLFLALYYLGLIDYSTTFSGPYTNRNLYSVVCSLLIIYYLTIGNNVKSKNLRVFLLVCFILLTASMKGLFGIILIFCLVKFKFKKIVNFLIIAVLTSSVLFFLYNADTLISQRLRAMAESLLNYDTSGIGSSSERLWLLINGFDIALKNIWTGIGLYNSKYYLFPPWQEILAQRRGETLDIGLYTHNNFLEIFLSTGIFGFILYQTPILFYYIKSIFSRISNNNIYTLFPFVTMSYILFLNTGLVSYNMLPIVLFLVLSIKISYEKHYEPKN